MKYRQINTNFWEDSYIRKLNPVERLAFIFLFTNDRVNLCGVYELTDDRLCYTLGATLETVNKIKHKFESDSKFLFHNDWVYILNYNEHNCFSKAPNVVSTFMKEFNSIPPEVASHFFSDDKPKYVPTIKEWVTVMEMVMVMDKYPTPYPRIKLKYEELDINELPDNIGGR